MSAGPGAARRTVRGAAAARRAARGAAAASATLLIAACITTGPTTTESREAGAFSAISASAGIAVHVVVGGPPSVSVTAGQSVLPHVVTSVDGDRLRIETNGSTHGKVTVEVTVPSLTAVDVSSDAAVTAEGITGPTLAVNASSGATVELSGSADALTLNGSSQSSAKLGALQAKTAAVNLSSQARAEVRASEAVSGDVSSQASLTVLGSPTQVAVSTSSQGSVERR